jgi:hypothetical protein
MENRAELKLKRDPSLGKNPESRKAGWGERRARGTRRIKFYVEHDR